MRPEKILHLGDLALTLPAAAAIAAWLLAAGAWRGALGWTALYWLAIGLVGASKIAFLGWGTGLPSWDFKAISGHATGATAVFPTCLYLVFRGQRRLREPAVAAGLALGAAVAAMLVLADEHAWTEALAGWLLGAATSLASLPLARGLPASAGWAATACATLAFAGAAWLMTFVPVNYLMVRAALALSGSDRLHPWDSCG